MTEVSEEGERRRFSVYRHPPLQTLVLQVFKLNQLCGGDTSPTPEAEPQPRQIDAPTGGGKLTGNQSYANVIQPKPGPQPQDPAQPLPLQPHLVTTP